MGDFRAGIKIEFSMGGVEESQEWWINWSPDDQYGGIDYRIGEWITTHALDGAARIQEGIDEGFRETKKIFAEQQERAELARLKAKYD